MTGEKKNNSFNFQFKHLVYLLIAGILGGIGLFLGDKITDRTAEFISKPFINEKKLKIISSEINLMEKKLNSNIILTNELWSLKDSLTTKKDLKQIETKIVKTIKSEIQNNLTAN